MKKQNVLHLLAWVLIASMAVLTSCKDDEEEAKEATLYERLGKVEAISAVVDQFLANVVADNTINGRFSATVADNSRVTALRNNLINQICQGTGGPCTYTGKTMMAAHAGMNITEAEFGALVGD